MIEQPPQPQEKEGEKQLRDTAFWAEAVETLMVSEAPAVHQYQDRQQFPHVLLS
jgi:hypothetical protein